MERNRIVRGLTSNIKAAHKNLVDVPVNNYISIGT